MSSNKYVIVYTIIFILLFTSFYTISNDNVYWMRIIFSITTFLSFVSLIQSIHNRANGKIHIWIDRERAERLGLRE